MGYRLNRLDEPVFIALSKPLLTEFGIHHRLESCECNLGETERWPLMATPEMQCIVIANRGSSEAKYAMQ